MVQRFHYPSQSYPDYLDLRDRNRTFESLMAFQIIGPVGVDTGAIPRRRGLISPAATTSTPSESSLISAASSMLPTKRAKNSAPYVVLSYAYWHSHFHGDHGVVGRTIAINKHPFTIIGVAPPGFPRNRALLRAGLVGPHRRRAHPRGHDILQVPRRSLAVGRRPPQARRHSRPSNRRPQRNRRTGWPKPIPATTMASNSPWPAPA